MRDRAIPNYGLSEGASIARDRPSHYVFSEDVLKKLLPYIVKYAIMTKKMQHIGEYLMDYTLQNCQKLVDDWIHDIGIRYFSELTNTAILMEEVGELARLMARHYGDQSFKENERNRDLGEEMADIFFVLICLANQTGVDLEAAFKKSIEKKTQRDTERHQNNVNLQEP